MSDDARRATARRAATSRWIRERFGDSSFAGLGLPGGDIVCKPECNCHEDCPALGFPDDYGCSLFIGTGGTSVGRCVPPQCLNPKNDLIGLCQLFL